MARLKPVTKRPSLRQSGPTLQVGLGQVFTSLIGAADLSDAGPESPVRKALPFDPERVPQVRDLFNLFDTTADLSGADIDVSAFVRDADEQDVHLFWRDEQSRLGPGQFRGGVPFKKLLPARQELCPVAAWRFREFLGELEPEQRRQVWVRDYRKGWLPADADRIYAGQIVLLHESVGGYDELLGWTGNSRTPAASCAPPDEPSDRGETLEDEDESSEGKPQSILEHSRDVAGELRELLKDTSINAALSADERQALNYTPTWHDRGKAHLSFCAKIKAEHRPKESEQPLAKAPSAWWKANFERDPTDDPLKRRTGFRHELASALALIETLALAKPDHCAIIVPGGAELAEACDIRPVHSSPDSSCAAVLGDVIDLDERTFNLLLYLVAAHHGKVRLGLRSTEDDYDPDQMDAVPADKRRCRGVQDDDCLPACDLPDAANPSNGFKAAAVKLNLGLMEPFDPRYGRSWTDRMRDLLEVMGPFRLSYLECLVRAADRRASKKGTSVAEAAELRGESKPCQ